jgi:hypothetical protein
MVKIIGGFLAVLLLAGLVACSSLPVSITPTPVANVKKVKEAELSGKWALRQLEINMEGSIAIVLMLDEGDVVEGYFFLEKGDNIDFQITGESLIYESDPIHNVTENVTSDRFSFTATQEQGIAYTLTLSVEEKEDPKKNTDTTVFLEIIYPVTGEVFVPIGTK